MSSIDPGLTPPDSWLAAIALALAGLAVTWAYTPLADRWATRWFARPPDLSAFRALQQSRTKLVAGIVLAWILGGFLEEFFLRGIVLQAVKAVASPALGLPLATAAGIAAATAIAWVIHLYQGLRAAFIIAQLSVLFGVLFVIGGFDLWPVIFCHGLYDTIAFIRFANRQSRYSDLGAP